jgi:MEMO1 family protein
MLRSPAVAGHFYKASPEALKKQVEGFIISGAIKRQAIGIVVPHAGLIYSGSVAGAVYSSIEIPDTIILIGPNHTGLGAAVSLMAKGSWETPLGTVEIDEALAAYILSQSTRIHEDSLAHLREHSLEVQLPFIQYFKKKFKIVPIQMLDTRLETCLEVGRTVGAAIAEYGIRNTGKKTELRTPIPENQAALDVLIVASSDMSHYEPADRAKAKDSKAIHSILSLDPEGLYHIVRDYEITMCGYGPTVAMLAAAKILGATNAELIKYSNSGETSGDYDKVVGYAGIVVT